MARAIAIIKMVQDGEDRGRPWVARDVSFVHLGSVELPGGYKAYVICGSGADLLAVSQSARFLVGQQITNTGEVTNWSDANKAAAPGAIELINTWLVNNGYDALTGENSIVDLLKVFDPDIESKIGADNVHDAYAA